MKQMETITFLLNLVTPTKIKYQQPPQRLLNVEISQSKCANWHRISKLASNFGYLFTFCYMDGANSIKTDLHIFNWPVCKLQVCNLVLI